MAAFGHYKALGAALGRVDDRGDVTGAEVRLEFRQVKGHHFIADELVDHGVGEQDILSAAVEAAQQCR